MASTYLKCHRLLSRNLSKRCGLSVVRHAIKCESLLNISRCFTSSREDINTKLQQGNPFGLPSRSMHSASICRNSLTVEFATNKCASCGISLQTSNPKELGYFVPPKETKVKRKSDYQYTRVFQTLDNDAKEFLLNNIEETAEVSKSTRVGRKFVVDDDTIMQNGEEESNEIGEGNVLKKKLICKRCHDIRNHGKVDHIEDPVDIKSLLGKIERGGTVIHVVDGTDFPFTLNPLIFDICKDHKVKMLIFVITKMDKIGETWKSSNKWFASYFSAAIENICNNKPRYLVLTSAGNKKWGTDVIDSLIPKDGHNTYFIGEPNVGKSTLVKDLILESRGPYAASRRRKLTVREQMQIGPGISEIPNFTREEMRFDLGSGGRVTDLPGYEMDSEGSSIPLKLVKPGLFAKVNKIRSINKKLNKKSHYISLSGGKCLSIGGFLYIVPPKDMILQIKETFPIIRNQEAEKFGSIEKARLRAREQKGQHKDWFFTRPEVEETLVRYELPEFNGSVDVLIRGLGVVNITATGSKDKQKGRIIELWVPEALKLAYRDPINKYTLNKYDIVNKTGVKPNASKINYFTRLHPAKNDTSKEEVTKKVIEGSIDINGSKPLSLEAEPNINANINASNW